MTIIRHGNNASTTLSAGITNVATTATVVANTGWPTLTGGDGFYLTFDDGAGKIEIVLVTAYTGTTINTMARAQQGTTAQAFSSGDTAEIRMTAGAIDDKLDTPTATATVATDDKVVILDTSASDLPKTVTAQSIADLASLGCKVYASSAQSIANNTTTTLNFNTEVFDDDSMHDNVTNNSRVTINTAGLYLVLCNSTFDAGSTGVRQNIVMKNGTTNIGSFTLDNQGASSQTEVPVFSIERFVFSDYVEARVYHNQGTNLNVEVLYHLI